MDVKPSYGLTDDQVEAMILESYDKAEEDFKERQVREARVEADAILGAVDKAKEDDAYQALAEEERAAIDRADQRAASRVSQRRSPADPGPDREIESGYHGAGGSDHERSGGQGAQGNEY